MANPEHVEIVKQGVEAIRQWRKVYPGEQLNLRAADLSRADLFRAHLTEANLTGADLTGADLFRARLRAAHLTGARLFETVFGNTDLTATQGLATCRHDGPSTLDHRTLAQSGPLPLAFLRGCGLPDVLIDYLPSLLDEPLQFYSCFISYSSQDEDFAHRLHADLQDHGVRCWFAPKDMKIGDRLRLRIDETIRTYEKLLLILSKHSIVSQWVEQEVETALAQERKTGRTILFPVRIDNAIRRVETGWPALLLNTRHIGDFTRRKPHDAYQQAFGRLLRDLRAEAHTDQRHTEQAHASTLTELKTREGHPVKTETQKNR